MKFSFVTATLNCAATLPDALDSLMGQSYRNIEVIVVDGSSTDGTLEIIKRYEPLFGGRMKWVSERDNGLYDAMNKGFRMATGDVVSVLNSDDFLVDDNVVAKLANCFGEHPEADGVYADLFYVSRHNPSRIVRHWISGRQRPFASGWHPAHPTFYVKRAFCLAHELFDLRFEYAADFEWMLRLMEKERLRMVYLPEALVKMRMGGTTNRSLRNIWLGNKECMRAFKKNGVRVGVLYPFYRLLPKLKQFWR